MPLPTKVQWEISSALLSLYIAPPNCNQLLLLWKWQCFIVGLLPPTQAIAPPFTPLELLFWNMQLTIIGELLRQRIAPPGSGSRTSA